MCIFIVILQVVLLDEKEMKLRYLTQENEDLKQQIKLYQVCTYVYYSYVYVLYVHVHICMCAYTHKV